MSIKHFHHYLYGRKFTVRTDHGALRWFLNFKNPEGQMARWLEILSSYDFEIIHRAGKSHSNADSLSRHPCFSSNCKHCHNSEIKESLHVDVKDHIETNQALSANVLVVTIPNKFVERQRRALNLQKSLRYQFLLIKLLNFKIETQTC